ncbi:MAG: hypothetical protein HZB39_20885 [Planctomycetes bacterium]|nr:hypothetical protein [Planctomycetota bacterium]
MNVPCIAVLAAVTFAAAAPSQTNWFEIHCGHTSFTSRGHITGPHSGDVCTRVPAEWFSSVGGVWDPGSLSVVGRVNGMRLVLQDQDAITQEPFSVALIAEDSGMPGQPDLLQSGEYLRVGNLTTPGGTNGPAAWLLSITFTTPFDGLPADRDFFMACGLPANPLWPADGLSVHIGRVGFGDDPITGGVTRTNFACSIDPAGLPIIRNYLDRSFRVGVLTQAPLLQVGASLSPLRTNPNDPQYGIAGIYPDNATACDEFAFRVRTTGPSTAFVFGNFTPFSAPVSWGPMANFCLPLVPLPFFVTPVTIGSGASEGEMNVSSLCTAWGRLSFQAIDFAGPVQFTNAAGVLSQ